MPASQGGAVPQGFKAADGSPCPERRILMNGGQRRKRHAGDIHIVEPDDGDILRHARAAFAQPRDDGGGVLIAADADAREIPPRGQLPPQRNAALGVKGEQIGH